MRRSVIDAKRYARRCRKSGRSWALFRLLFALSVASVLILAGSFLTVHKAANDASKMNYGYGSAAITYQPNAHVLEREEGMAALKAVSKDGSTLLFESRNPKLQSLKAGDVLLIKGLLARKILATDIKGTQVAVLTDDASLGEAVRQAHIQVNAPISFAQPSAQNQPDQMESPFEKLVQFVPTAYALSTDALRVRSAESKGQKDAVKGLAEKAITGVFQGWDTTFSATSGGGKLNISIKLTKDIGGFRAIITGEGYLSDFDLSSDIDVDDGKVQQMKVLHKKISGVMNFKWEVGKDTPGVQTGDYHIKLPAAISIPLYQYLEGFPLFLEISAAVIIKPAISGGKEFSRGAFRITFNGNQSFQVKEGNIDADGHVTGDIQFVESQNISALAPLGMVVGFAAPRIELTFGASKIVKFDELKEAAEKVDMIADQLMKRVLSEDTYQRFKSSPLDFKFSKTLENALKSDAAAYIELVATGGMSHSGFSAIFPCTRTDLHLIVKVGASAQAFGQQIAEKESEIFKKDFTRVDPPGTRQCEEIVQ